MPFSPVVHKTPVPELPSIKNRLLFFERRCSLDQDVVYGGMIPDPDYSDEDLDHPTQTPKINHSINNKSISCGILSNKNKSSLPPSSINSISSSPPVSVLSSSPIPAVPSSPASGNTSPAPQALTMVARNNRANSNSEDADVPPTKSGSPLLQQKENKNNRFDENGLVLPKKLINPSLDSTEKKSLHRELLFNQKIGASVLNQKTELQKAMEKHKGKQMAKEQEREKQANLTPFQRALEQQALKLEQAPEKNEETKKEPETTLEFQKLQARLRSKLDAQ
ncbi:Protein of unknown function DUF1151 [Trinorchestia longiramus]|nr:Protein of unknown function DUF1151 [Trinorchestia longiramus]